jgi:hypothetical protein
MAEPRQIVKASEVKARQIVPSKPNPVQLQTPQGSPTSVGASQALGTASMRNLLTNAQPVKKQGFVSKGFEGAKALAKGEVSATDVIKEVPRAIVSVGANTGGFVAGTLIPAVKNFTKTTGSIIGEGLAYALDPQVRKAYNSGRTDVLPTINETTQRDIVKATVGAGLEVTLLRYIPDVAKKAILVRGGVGALEGMGYAVSTGLAEDKTPEEIIESLPAYGVTGAVATIAAPYLLPILKAEVGKVTPEVKNLFKGIYSEVKGKQPVKPPVEVKKDVSDEKFEYLTDNDVDTYIGSKSRLGYTPEEQKGIYNKYIKSKVDNIKQPAEDETVVFYQPTEGTNQYVNTRFEKSFENNIDDNFRVEVVKKDALKTTGDEIKDKFGERLLVREEPKVNTKPVEVPREELPVGGAGVAGDGETKASALAKRLSAVDDPNVPTYNTSNQKANIAKAENYYKGKNTSEILDVLEGRTNKPKELSDIETNALLPVLLSRTNQMTPAELVRAATARDIRSLTATMAGKENSILQQIDPDNPINAIADINRVREAMAVKRAKATDVKVIKKPVKTDIEKAIAKRQLKVAEFEKELESILC